MAKNTGSSPFHLGWAFLLLGTAFSPISADYPIKHEACADAKASDFKVNYLFGHTKRVEAAGVKDTSVHNMIRFDLLPNGDDFDIFYGGFEGILYRYDSKKKVITKIRDFQTIRGSVSSPYSGGDHGLTGIQFHPNFKQNRWLFVFYTPKVTGPQNRVMRLSRFEMTSDFQLQKEKILLSIEATSTDKWHSGGDMYFTAQGDLFLQVGDNVQYDQTSTNKSSNAAWTSGNTTNLLGGTIRIHPDSSARGYSIPKDNFGEYFSKTMSPAYLDTSRVKPEIYVKGARSNYTATGHPIEPLHLWGEVTSHATDEINVIDRPVFAGWPFYQGNPSLGDYGGSTKRYPFALGDAPKLTTQVSGTLVDTTKAMGTLPKVYPADVVVGKEFNVVAVQALYYYGYGDSIWKGRTFPPHFHETFMFSNWAASSGVRIVPLTRKPNDYDNVSTDLKDDSYDVRNLLGGGNSRIFVGMVEAKYGPDGALYILARGGQYASPAGLLTRIDYVGNCQDAALFNKNQAAFKAAAATSSDASRYRSGFYEAGLYNGSTGIYTLDRPLSLPKGEQLNVDVDNLQGQKVMTYSSKVARSNQVPLWDGAMANGKRASGIYILKYSNAAGVPLLHNKQAF